MCWGFFFNLFVNLKVLHLYFVLHIELLCTVCTISHDCLRSEKNWLQKKGLFSKMQSYSFQHMLLTALLVQQL